MQLRSCYPSPCLPQNPPPPQPPRFTPPHPRRPRLITSSPHHFALVHHRKNAILYFQELAHSSQFTIPPIPRVLLRLRTLCQKHRGVGLVSLAKFPILL